MKREHKVDYAKGVAGRLKEDQANRIYNRCGKCGLKIKAQGINETERIYNHEKGFHCQPSGNKKKRY